MEKKAYIGEKRDTRGAITSQAMTFSEVTDSIGAGFFLFHMCVQDNFIEGMLQHLLVEEDVVVGETGSYGEERQERNVFNRSISWAHPVGLCKVTSQRAWFYHWYLLHGLSDGMMFSRLCISHC